VKKPLQIGNDLLNFLPAKVFHRIVLYGIKTHIIFYYENYYYYFLIYRNEKIAPKDRA